MKKQFNNEKLVNSTVNNNEEQKLVVKFSFKEFKHIFRLAFPIFIQLVFDVLITQINTILIAWYKEGAYYAVVSKATIAFNFLQFTPSLIAGGTLIVCGNLIGQKKYLELNKVIVSGIIVNLIVCSLIYAISAALSPYLLKLMSAQNENITKNGVIYESDELKFATKYYMILQVRLVIMSVVQVFIASLQAIKKSKHVTIGAVISNFLDALIVSLFLFAFDINPIWVSISIPIAGLFQLVYMLIITLKYIDFKTNKGFLKNIKWLYIKETIKMGFPIALEMGLWNLANLIANMGIAHLGVNESSYVLQNRWLEFHRSVNSINQYSTVFVQAISTVTSVLVATKIGEKDLEGAFHAGLNCWKTAMIVSAIASTLILALTYPLLKIFNTPTDLINQYGYLLFSILLVKQLFDTVNLTLLRALWAAYDLYFPLIISLITMYFGQVAFPFVFIFGFDILNGWGLILTYIGFTLDPLIRSAVYTDRWFKKKWMKKARPINLHQKEVSIEPPTVEIG